MLLNIVVKTISGQVFSICNAIFSAFAYDDLACELEIEDLSDTEGISSWAREFIHKPWRGVETAACVSSSTTHAIPE